MLEEEMHDELLRVAEYYGHKLKPIEEDEFWRVFRRQEVADFQLATAKHIEKEQYFPRVNQIKGFLDWLEEERHKQRGPHPAETAEDCPHCDNTGYVPSWHIDDDWGFGSTVERCRCTRGQRKPAEIKTCGHAFDRTFNEHCLALFEAEAKWKAENVPAAAVKPPPRRV